jgi:hypothetical protein
VEVSLASALDGGEWSASGHDHFATGDRSRYPLNRRPGGTRSQSGGGGDEKNMYPSRESNSSPSARHKLSKLGTADWHCHSYVAAGIICLYCSCSHYY